MGSQRDAFLKHSFPQHADHCLDGRIIRDSIFPTQAGGYADVYEGFLKKQPEKGAPAPSDNTHVAIKVVRPFQAERTKLLRRLWREYLTWSRLSHPNILPCLGYSHDFSYKTCNLPSLISPWMKHGTVSSYLEKHPNTDRKALLVDIANGLSYLHTQEPVIVHGDLRVGNVLVSDEGIACLADFGLSRVLQEVRGMTTTSEVAGSVRWMAPELFQNDAKVTVHSDTWAYGMTVLEVLTGERPYSSVRNDAVVFGQIREGKIPSRPFVVDDRTWDICEICWSLEPKARPAMEDIPSMIIPPRTDLSIATARSYSLYTGICGCGATCACSNCIEHSDVPTKSPLESCPYGCLTCSNCNELGHPIAPDIDGTRSSPSHPGAPDQPPPPTRFHRRASTARQPPILTSFSDLCYVTRKLWGKCYKEVMGKQKLTKFP